MTPLLSLIICAVVPSAIGTPSRSALSFSARMGGMVASTLHTSLFQVAEVSLMAKSLTLKALNRPFRGPVIVDSDYKVQYTLQ